MAGGLAVVYYDRRADPDEHAFNEASLQASTDGGATFTDRVAVSDQPFDSCIGFRSFRRLPDIGNRIALDSDADQATAVWTDTRAGTEVSGKQDLTRGVVAVAGGPAWPPAALQTLRAGRRGIPPRCRRPRRSLGVAPTPHPLITGHAGPAADRRLRCVTLS